MNNFRQGLPVQLGVKLHGHTPPDLRAITLASVDAHAFAEKYLRGTGLRCPAYLPVLAFYDAEFIHTA